MRIHHSLLLVLSLGAGLAASGAQALEVSNSGTVTVAEKDYLTVKLDLATIARVPGDTATLVVGNPSIADALLPADGHGLMVLTGRSYGSTNVVALDRNGAPLREIMIKVQQPAQQSVTVQRGMARETWSCTPRCEQTLTLGDNPEYFNGSNTQIGARNATAVAR